MNGNSNEVRIFSGSSLGDNAVRFNQGGQEFIEFGTTAGLFGVTGTNLATLDVGGHEFTHGVTANEANLVFAGESGALNESFSDIFGTMTERFARGGTFNWTLAEDAGFVLRDMQSKPPTNPILSSISGCPIFTAIKIARTNGKQKLR